MSQTRYVGDDTPFAADHTLSGEEKNLSFVDAHKGYRPNIKLVRGQMAACVVQSDGGDSFHGKIMHFSRHKRKDKKTATVSSALTGKTVKVLVSRLIPLHPVNSYIRNNTSKSWERVIRYQGTAYITKEVLVAAGTTTCLNSHVCVSYYHTFVL